MTKIIERHEAGSKIGAYTLERGEPLERLDGTYYELRHQPTGARHIHVAVPDIERLHAFLMDQVSTRREVVTFRSSVIYQQTNVRVLTPMGDAGHGEMT